MFALRSERREIRMGRICAFVISLAFVVATPGLATADPHTWPARNQQAIDSVIARARFRSAAFPSHTEAATPQAPPEAVARLPTPSDWTRRATSSD